ncbi:MAG TPA: ABC transporter permease [Verrucomicrobiae bacterium]|nr:ABC transporter permease [Verrucomicrobiae bacterium]
MNTAPTEIVIESRRRPRLLHELGEVWRYRELLRVLVRRDITVRYKETWLGVFWAVLQPVALMTVFWFALGRVLRVSTGELPYPLFVLAGLLPWTFFSTAISSSMGSLVGASHLIQKVYFPRLIIPLSTLGVPFLDFAIGAAILAAVFAWLKLLAPGAMLALLPLLLIGLAAIALGTLSAALAASYRDTRHMIPLVMQVWMFATPVFYPADIVVESMRWAIDFNPMAPLIDSFRRALVGAPLDWAGCGRSGFFFAAMLWCATWFFMRVERRLSDTL